MGFRESFIRLRKERGWTQQHVADEIGISVGQVKKYEKGDSSPTLPILAKMATVFGVTADDLVFGGRNGLAASKLDVELLRRFEMLDHLPGVLPASVREHARVTRQTGAVRTTAFAGGAT